MSGKTLLEAITVEYGKNKILQKDTPHYRLIGLPFLLTIRKMNNLQSHSL